MHKLGEQWIEIIDGEEHMKKCVGLADDMSEVVIDLGILKNGLLPCLFCKEYPMIIIYKCKNGTKEYGIYHICKDHWFKVETKHYKTVQEVKDVWNRRV